jgi:hypothetical protein
MSETKTKSKEDIVKDIMDKKAEDFKADLRALEDKYEYRLEPSLHFSPRGIVPTINVVDVPKEEKSVV